MTDVSFVKTDPTPQNERAFPGVPTLLRCVLAGVLMGLANLVPGISGGTMLVAAGVYRRFIDAVSDISRLRFRLNTLAVLGAVIFGAIVAIGAGSGLISLALEQARWAAFSVFIGLTMGGAPILWKLMRPITRSSAITLALGFVAMGAIVYLQSGQTASNDAEANGARLAIAGAAAASAMILPGISGAYLLLLIGVYETVIGAIKDSVNAAASLDIGGVTDQLGVILPIGIGVVIGVVGVSNILRIVLHRYEKATLGFLLGLLLAAPLGLYPFVRGIPPEPGHLIKGELVTEENRTSFDPKEWHTERFTPGAMHIAGAIGLMVVGVGLTLGIARLGGPESTEDA